MSIKPSDSNSFNPPQYIKGINVKSTANNPKNSIFEGREKLRIQFTCFTDSSNQYAVATASLWDRLSARRWVPIHISSEDANGKKQTTTIKVNAASLRKRFGITENELNEARKNNQVDQLIQNKLLDIIKQKAIENDEKASSTLLQLSEEAIQHGHLEEAAQYLVKLPDTMKQKVLENIRDPLKFYDLGCQCEKIDNKLAFRCYRSAIAIAKQSSTKENIVKDKAVEAEEAEESQDWCHLAEYFNAKKCLKQAYECYQRALTKIDDAHVNVPRIAQNLYDLGRSYDLNSQKGDAKLAFQCYSLAAEKGHMDAQKSLVSCIMLGIGTEKNPIKAMDLNLQMMRRSQQTGNNV
jgi:tetratricopeptide (TPR) repeat protein